MAGHVFLTHSDLSKLHCDTWLLPSDRFFFINPAWRISRHVRDQVDRLRMGDTQPPTGWGDSGVRVIPLSPSADEPWRPSPHLVNVGADATAKLDWYMDGARQFLSGVADQIARVGARSGRAKPLVGLPLIGTGLGGASGAKGAVVRALLDVLHQAAELHDLDIVLMVKDEPAFVAAQNARRQYLQDRFDRSSEEAWPELETRLVNEAKRLAANAASGRLVLFIGAGVSQGAALPNWDALLEGLAQDAGMTAQERMALARLHELDRPRIIQHRLENQGVKIGQAVSDHLSADGFSLAHSLLAPLPVTEVVTTNYDCLFEEASAAADRATAILPYQSVVGHSRWLLKLHGSVTHPEDIILTREDYLRYSDRRAALGAIVQALLTTRHMLFIGFSLKDDSFHRIVDDVRKAIRGTSAQQEASTPFGSALLLRKDELLEELWRNDLQLVSVGGGKESKDAARQLEIFLDLLLSEASLGTSPLLDSAYDAVLTDEEREIRGLLRALEAGVSDSARRSSAWRPLGELLQRLGGSASFPS